MTGRRKSLACSLFIYHKDEKKEVPVCYLWALNIHVHTYIKIKQRGQKLAARSGKEFFYKEKQIRRRNRFSDKEILSRTQENLNFFFFICKSKAPPSPQANFVLFLLQLKTFFSVWMNRKLKKRNKGSNFTNSF